MPLSVLIDNTTLQRAGLLLADQARLPTQAELANVLHGIESLVMSDEIQVSTFEDADSARRSDQARDVLASHGLQVGQHRLSGASDQLRLSEEVVAEMDQRGLFSFSVGGNVGVTSLDVTRGLPIGAGQMVADFWSDVARRDPSPDGLLNEGLRLVEEYRAGGLFIYALIAQPGLLEQIQLSQRRGDGPSDDEWMSLHVAFRALFNQRMAAQSTETRYAPSPVRSDFLQACASYSLARLEQAIAVLVQEGRERVFSTEKMREMQSQQLMPIPLIGLSLMLESRPGTPVVERLIEAREAAGPIRSRLETLNRMDANQSRSFQRLLQVEVEALGRAGRRAMGGPSPLLEVPLDWNLDLDIGSPTPKNFSFGVSAAAKAVKVAMQWHRSRKYSILSRGATRLARNPQVTSALWEIMR